MGTAWLTAGAARPLTPPHTAAPLAHLNSSQIPASFWEPRGGTEIHWVWPGSVWDGNTVNTFALTLGMVSL